MGHLRAFHGGSCPHRVDRRRGREERPGVLGVVTAADLGLTPAPFGLPLLNQAMLRTCSRPTRCASSASRSSPIVTETRTRASTPPSRCSSSTSCCPRSSTCSKSRDGETLLFEDAGTNVVIDGAIDGRARPADDFFDGCEVVVRQRIVNQRVAPCPLEVRAAAAAWDDGRLVQWSSTQHAPGHAPRRARKRRTASTPGQVRVIAPDVGGGFGAKIGAYPEELLLGG